MANLRWNGDDFRNSKDSSGAIAGKISRSGDLQQGYWHGSLTQGLVAYYPMDSGSGSTVEDKTELGNDGKLKPGTSGTTTTSGMWDSDSKIGNNCLSFDGQDDYVQVPQKTISGAWTVSTWHNISDDGATWRRPLDGSDFSIRLSQSNGTKYGFTEYGVEDYKFSTNLIFNSWTHVVWVGTGSSVRLYLNGDLKDTNSKYVKCPIGNINGGASIKGYLDDLRIYNRTLSRPELQALYNLSTPSKVFPADTLH